MVETHSRYSRVDKMKDARKALWRCSAHKTKATYWLASQSAEGVDTSDRDEKEVETDFAPFVKKINEVSGYIAATTSTMSTSRSQ